MVSAVGSLLGRFVPGVNQHLSGNTIQPLGDPLHVATSRIIAVGPQTHATVSQHLQGLGAGRAGRPGDRGHGWYTSGL